MTGKVPEGMELLLDIISTTDELRPHLKAGSLSRGYLKALAQIHKDHFPLLHKHARVFCADLNGPTDRCLFVVLASYPTLVSDEDRPMMLEIHPTLAAIIEPWANILHEQFRIPFEQSYNILSKITMIFDCFPISGRATYASDNSKDFQKLLVELVLPHSKLMFDDVVAKIPSVAAYIAYEGS